MYNGLFTKPLEEYTGYDAIEILFLFRNNAAHSLAHMEEARTTGTQDNLSPIKSTNNHYEIIRRFLIQRRLVNQTESHSNVNRLWSYSCASYLWFEARCFLGDALKENEFVYNDPIRSEWQTALSGNG